MNDFISAALDCFGIESRRTVKEKGSYICHTPAGLVKLAKTYESPEAIRLAHTVKEHAAVKGFVYTDRYILGPEGLPYAQLGVDRYVASRISHGRELDLASPREVLDTVSQIARFHANARGLEAECPAAVSCEGTFTRGRDAVRQAVKHVNRQKQRSDFDILFIKNAPVFEERIDRALVQLAASPYLDMYAQALRGNHVTHNALKEEYILIADGTPFFTHFTAVNKNIQLYDLASFIRRYTAKNKKDSLPLPRLLEAYNKNSPLPDGSEAVIRAMLFYPAPFVRIVEQCYAKKRSWIPAGLLNRLEEILED
ncbi:MAG: hypothetical protein FWD90_10685 [Defluviitaleaceae bacterium]|nr:hypothetical protein [Defluviitaleaceae bacterium]